MLLDSPLASRFIESMDSGLPTFQIESKHFKTIKASPRNLIPTYSADEVPRILKEYGLELFRNLSGGCILIKTKQFSLPTLFPSINHAPSTTRFDAELPETLQVLSNHELHNEETGILLFKELGLLNRFLESSQTFSIGCRIRTTVDGKLIVLNQTIPVKKCQLEADSFFETSDSIHLVEAKLVQNDFRTSFSLHQLALPTLLLSKYTNKAIFSILLEYLATEARLFFKVLLYSIPYNKGAIIPHRYSLLKEHLFIANI